MMGKVLVSYCSQCGKKTKHEVIQCKEKLGWRIFEGVLSLGLIPMMDGYDYYCECSKCGHIKTIRR